MKRLADSTGAPRRQNQKKMLADNVYALAADPTKPHANPTALQEVPQFDFAPLDQAAAKLKTSAKAYDDALAANGAQLSGGRSRAPASADAVASTRPCCWTRACPSATGTRIRSTRRAASPAMAPRPCRACAKRSRKSAGQTPRQYIGLTAGTINAYSARLDEATGDFEALIGVPNCSRQDSGRRDKRAADQNARRRLLGVRARPGADLQHGVFQVLGRRGIQAGARARHRKARRRPGWPLRRGSPPSPHVAPTP